MFEELSFVGTKLGSDAPLSQMHHDSESSGLPICKGFGISFSIIITLKVNAAGKKDFEAEVLQKLDIFLRVNTSGNNSLPLLGQKMRGELVRHWKSCCQRPLIEIPYHLTH